MAIIKNGILGGFKGKTGTVVGYHLNGQDIMRVLGHERSTPPTSKEMANRRKFAASQKWLQPLTGFLRVGFQDYAPTFQGFVAAKSYNSKNAIAGENPDFYIDPAMALVSFGDQEPAETATVASESPGTITFRWSGGKRQYDDRAMFLAYDIEAGQAYFDTGAIKRQKGTGVLETSTILSGKKVHIYLAFVSENRKRRSKSQYLGVITVL